MSAPNNPAGRLHAWLSRAYEWYGTHEDGLASEGWSTLLGAEPETVEGRLRVLGHGAVLMDLATQARQRLASLDEAYLEQLLLRDFDNVEKTLNFFCELFGENNYLSMKQFLAPMSQGGWASLENVSEHLARRLPERTLASEVHEDLLAKVAETIDLVADLDEIELSAKTFVLDQLRSVQQALYSVSLRGTRPVQDAADSLLGGILRKSELGPDFLRSSAGKRVAEIILAVSVGLQMGSDFLAITDREGRPAIEHRVDIEIHSRDDSTVTVDPETPNDDGAASAP